MLHFYFRYFQRLAAVIAIGNLMISGTYNDKILSVVMFILSTSAMDFY